MLIAHILTYTITHTACENLLVLWWKLASSESNRA